MEKFTNPRKAFAGGSGIFLYMSKEAQSSPLLHRKNLSGERF